MQMDGIPPASIEPFSMLRVVKVSGGFLLVYPPAPALAAQDETELIATVREWLGLEDRDEDAPESFEGVAVPQDLTALDDPGAPLPEQSVYQVTKLRRQRKQGRYGYQCVRHTAAPGTAVQDLLWDRDAVLGLLRQWLRSAPDPAAMRETVEIETIVVEPGMDPDDPRVTYARVQTVRRAFGEGNPALAQFAGDLPPFVISRDTAPVFRWGLRESPIVHYLAVALDGDEEGYFAVRLVNTTLRVGPRIGDPGAGASHGALIT